MKKFLTKIYEDFKNEICERMKDRNSSLFNFLRAKIGEKKAAKIYKKVNEEGKTSDWGVKAERSRVNFGHKMIVKINEVETVKLDDFVKFFQENGELQFEHVLAGHYWKHISKDETHLEKINPENKGIGDRVRRFMLETKIQSDKRILKKMGYPVSDF